MKPEQALQRTGRFARGARIVGTLHAAATKASYLVERRGERFVLRVDRPLALRLGLDRPRELTALRAAWSAGLAPEPLMMAVDAPAVLLLRWAPGQAWSPTDLRDPRRLQRLAALLRRVHALTPPLPALDLDSALERYAMLAGTAASRTLAARAARLLRELRRGAGPGCLCHHDPVAANIVGRRHTVLIDWEYAALGDPLFDLAVVARHHRLPKRAVAQFAAAYFNGVGRVPWARLDRFRALYDCVYALWVGAVAVQSGPGRAA